MKPVVSIITVSYHHEKFIAQCIESVLRQTFLDWELLIVVDDADADRTCEIVNNYSDPRIAIIPHKERYGPFRLGDSYNEALARAQGAFIAILEADDLWPNYKLETQLKSFDDPECILSHGGYRVAREDGSITPFYNPLNMRLPLPLEVLENRPVGHIFGSFFNLQNDIVPVTVIIRKEALFKIGGFQHVQGLYVDIPTFCRLALEGEFKFIPKVLGYWRRHAHSTSFQYLSSFFSTFSQYTHDFASQYGDRLKALGVDVDVNKLQILHRRILMEKNKPYFDSYVNGRFYLFIGEWSKARSEFLKFLREYRPNGWRNILHYISHIMVAVIGIISTLIKKDLAGPLIWLMSAYKVKKYNRVY